MHEDDKVDLRPLDPSSDGPRWEAMIASVTARAIDARRRRPTVARELLRWGRATLAVAAVLAAIVWTGALRSHAAPRAQAEPVDAVSRWASSDQVPSAAEILGVLGGHHDER